MDKQETTMTTFTIKSRPTALALAAAFATMTMLASSASAKPAHASGASVSGSMEPATRWLRPITSPRLWAKPATLFCCLT
jgi:hypothetical protein